MSSGLLSGAFFYGWANVTPTFAAVPLDVHLTFRTQLMTLNGIVMQALMGATVTTAVLLAIVSRARARACAAGAAVLGSATFLVTRFGNVPINGEIKAWAAGDLAADYLDRLRTWGVFNDIRVATAVAAFVLVIVAADLTRRNAPAPPRVPARS